MPIEPLNAFIQDEHVDFIKIDVEGAELQVLAPALNYLKEHKPIILSEVHAEQLARVSGTTAGKYIQMIVDIGYECREITSEGKPGKNVENYDDIELIDVVFMPV